MASGAPAFRLDELPSEARDTVFGAMLRRDAARACCVSKGWRDSFGAPHLWATLDFTDEAAFRVGERGETKAERRPLAATVLAPCIAARGALTHVTLPQTSEVLALLPQLATSLPLLRRVTLLPSLLPANDVWYGGYHCGATEFAGVQSLLHRDGEPLEEVSLGVTVGLLYRDGGSGPPELMDNLLNDASPLKVTDLRVTLGDDAARMERFVAVMRAHAHTLRAVMLTTHHRRHIPRSVPITALLEALCACRPLETLYIEGSSLQGLHGAVQGAHPFAAVANALREAGTLRKLTLDGYTHELSVGDDGATPASLLLPGLTHLEIHGTHPWPGDFDARCVSSLARALQHNTTLRRLGLHYVRDVRMPGDAQDGGQAGAQDAVQNHMDGRPLLPLRIALPTTQLRRLEVDTGPKYGFCLSLAALAGALPRSLQQLDISDDSVDAAWTAELPLLLTAVQGLPRFSKLSLDRTNEKLFTAESLSACARMLLLPAAAPPLLRTLTLCSYDRALSDACVVLPFALESNTTLTDLSLYHVTTTTMGAFGAVLQRSAMLRRLSLTLTMTDHPMDEPLLAGALVALRTGLQHNVTLHALSVDLNWWPREDDDPDDEPHPWEIGPLGAALETLQAAGAEHPTCTLRIVTQYM